MPLKDIWVMPARRLAAFKCDKRAVTAIEYGLLAALLALAVINSVSTSGKDLPKTYMADSSGR